MRSLIWKEFHENLKWTAVPLVLYGLYVSNNGVCLCDSFFMFVSFLGAVFGGGLGILQMTFESHGDRRAILLHRPVSPSRIFLAKALTGAGLYLAALGIPLMVYLVGTFLPGHVAPHLAFPVRWQLLFPWFAGILAGLVYYFAGALLALRRGRWYGSRSLGFLAAYLCTFLVGNVSEFWQALLGMVLFGGLTAVAAWGSFLTAGDYKPQPLLAKFGLAFTFLTGLVVLSMEGKTIIESRLFRSKADRSDSNYVVDRNGRVLILERLGREGIRVKDRHGQELDEFRKKPVHEVRAELERLQAPLTSAHSESFHGHRNYRVISRFLVRLGNSSMPPSESWAYVPDQGRLVGYDLGRQQLIGSIGPDGFTPAGEQPHSRFEGRLDYSNIRANPDYLVFPGGVYTVDFVQRRLQLLFSPAVGETVLSARDWRGDGSWASLKDDRLGIQGIPGIQSYLRNESGKSSPIVVGTDRAIHLLDHQGTTEFSVPLAFDHQSHIATLLRLENPPRFAVDYQPSYFLGLVARQTMPQHIIEYDAVGHELSRTSLPTIPHILPTRHQHWFGLVTSPAEAATLLSVLYNDLFRTVPGQRVGYQKLSSELFEMVYSIFPDPLDLNAGLSSGRVRFYCVGILLNALLGAASCYWLARRWAFSRAHRLSWSCCGFFFGPTGLLLLLAIQERPARIACPSCRKLRIVTRDACEHCGTQHASPQADGTEIFEPTAAAWCGLPRPNVSGFPIGSP